MTAFAEMMTARTGSRDLEGWLAAVEADDQSGLRSFATGIRNDMPAVINGLTLHWNSGRVKGAVNKIKMIKRQMYGRAGFDLLLRKRVTLHLRYRITKFAAEPNYVSANNKFGVSPARRRIRAASVRLRSPAVGEPQVRDMLLYPVFPMRNY